MKTCIKCKETLPRDKFYTATSKGGLSSSCKECDNKRRKAHAEKHPEQYKKAYEKYKKVNPFGYRKYHYKTKYGLTEAQVEGMILFQNDKCLICQKEMGRGRNGAVVDHCHKTKKVRGILCALCNKAIGLLKDNPENMIRAYKYLIKHNYNPYES